MFLFFHFMKGEKATQFFSLPFILPLLELTVNGRIVSAQYEI